MNVIRINIFRKFLKFNDDDKNNYNTNELIKYLEGVNFIT